MVFAVAGILILQVVLLLTVPRLVRENPKRGVIIQAIYRSNFVLFGIPLTASIYGAGGTTLASMMIAIVIPIYNVTAVFILELFRGGKPRPAVLLKNVCTNPLILALPRDLWPLFWDCACPPVWKSPWGSLRT